ncbi:MAG: hypothetical protein ACXAAI_08595 [Promethearchaeota archaeon]|jgi:hypothetical protein
MAKKNILVMFLTVLITFSLIIAVPIASLSVKLSTYGRIKKLLTFEYNPPSPSSAEKLILNIVKGDIKIRYISQPVDYFVKIEVNLEMSGPSLAGKNYTDYFDIEWNKTSPSPLFMMDFDASVDKLSVIPLITDLSIVVSIRSDIMFDLVLSLHEGNVDLLAPFRVPINNVLIDITKGDTLFDFNHCNIQGNITVRIEEGDIDMKILNTIYTNNSLWNFTIGTGNFDLNISHDRSFTDLGANITGITTLNNGTARFIYKDTNINIGARFEIPFRNLTPRSFFPNCILVSPQNCELEGFHYNNPVLPEPGFPAEGSVIFTSNDLRNKQALHCYDLLYLINQRSFYMDLTSII